MGLETGDRIAQLNPNWPLGSDPKSRGDDHLRLVKKVVQGDALSLADGGTVTGAVTFAGGFDAVGLAADSHVKLASGSQLRWPDANDAQRQTLVVTNGVLEFGHTSFSAQRLTGDWRLTGDLEVVGDVTLRKFLTFDASAGTAVIDSGGNENLSLRRNGNEKLRVTADGIGVTGRRIDYATGGGAAHLNSGSDDDLVIERNGNEKLRVTAPGIAMTGSVAATEGGTLRNIQVGVDSNTIATTGAGALILSANGSTAVGIQLGGASVATVAAAGPAAATAVTVMTREKGDARYARLTEVEQLPALLKAVEELTARLEALERSRA